MGFYNFLSVIVSCVQAAFFSPVDQGDLKPGDYLMCRLLALSPLSCLSSTLLSKQKGKIILHKRNSHEKIKTGLSNLNQPVTVIKSNVLSKAVLCLWGTVFSCRLIHSCCFCGIMCDATVWLINVVLTFIWTTMDFCGREEEDL